MFVTIHHYHFFSHTIPSKSLKWPELNVSLVCFCSIFSQSMIKTAGLVSLLLLMIGILCDIIWVYYSEDHKSESWDQLPYSNPAGTSHHCFVKLPVSLFASAAGL